MTQDDVVYCASQTAAHKTHAELTRAYIGSEVLLFHAQNERDHYRALARSRADLKEAARVVRLHAEFVGKSGSDSRQRRALRLRALAERLDPLESVKP